MPLGKSTRIEIVEVVKVIPQERISERIVEQIVDVPVPQIMEEIVEVVQIIPQERVQNRKVELWRSFGR